MPLYWTLPDNQRSLVDAIFGLAAVVEEAFSSGGPGLGAQLRNPEQSTSGSVPR